MTPTGYSAIGLPAGLVLDPNTGIISGVPTLSGNYTVTIIAHTPYGDASGTFYLTIQSLATPTLPVATFSLNAVVMVADTNRPRIYLATSNGIAVLDTNSLSITNTIPVTSPTDISISADGSKLWLTRNGETVIGSVDLETLAPLPDIVTTVRPSQIREGLQGRLYVTGWENGAAGMFQVDPATGATQTHFTPAPAGYESFSYLMEITPDRKTLFAGAWGNNGFPFAQYDISTGTPSLSQTRTQGAGCRSVNVSHDGTRVCFVPWVTYYPATTNELSGANINSLLGGFSWTGSPGEIAYSPDNASAIQTDQIAPTIGVLNVQTFALSKTINLPSATAAMHVVVDSTGTYLFASLYGAKVEVYRLKSQPSVVPPHSLINVSTRTFVQTGDNVEIGGFIIHGDQPKKVVLRAVGPTLSQYGLPAITDPILELHDSSGAIVASNDNWNSHRQDVLQTGLSPSNEHEAVIVATLPPGAYTAILKGLNGATGTALFELYDVDPANSKIANISTRANVGTGDNVMIGGFIVGGDQPTNVIVRAIGPSLTQAGVSDALLNPVLELRDGSGNLVAQNDDWQSDQQQPITNTGLAPSDTHESAILAPLPPGGYTAIVRGKNNTTGVALVEVYNLSQ
jgi:putative Ig domain-containing protein